MDVLEVLRERGFIENTTHDRELKEYLQTETAVCYIGFDPTASSLHVGSLVPIMALAHMQRHDHRPIALVGGGTAMIGDPSGKTEMRQILSLEEIHDNVQGIKGQLANFIRFGQGGALLVNNADWLPDIRYIPFLRDIGRHFSVNRMIKAESYKMRLDSEEGLNFIEFNYMLLQAYDFLKLFEDHGCRLQMGGSDQWGNIVAGIELVRRKRQETVFGITFPLITTSSGEKMGKTAKGAVWLDPGRTSPYDYFQFWVNTDDRDVPRFMALFTFLPMEEVRSAARLQGADLNLAKTILAFEATLLAHGREAAVDAYHAAARMFGAKSIARDLMPSSSIPRGESDGGGLSVPQTAMKRQDLGDGMAAFLLFHHVGLAATKSEARRLIEQGGAYVNQERVERFDQPIGAGFARENELVLRAGKKRYHKIVLE